MAIRVTLFVKYEITIKIFTDDPIDISVDIEISKYFCKLVSSKFRIQ